MADEFGGNAGARKERFFEREDAQRFYESTADQVDAPRAPRPELRANVIDILHAEGEQFSRQPQMKTGKVGEDCETRIAMFGRSDESPHRADQRRKMAQNFRDAHDRNF